MTREEREGGRLRLEIPDAQATITGLMGLANERGLRLTDLSARSADLEDVFMARTGRGLRV